MKQAAVPHRPVDETSEEPGQDTAVQHVSQGLPISPEDYERMKVWARFQKASGSPIGHQDASVNSDRED